MEYAILVLIILGIVFFQKVKSFFLKNEETTLTKKEAKIAEEANSLKNDIENLNKKLNKVYHPDMTPEEIEEFWRGKK